jgi:hypothetical protein
MSESIYVYDFLKENPQVRDSMLKYEWASIFTDKSIAKSVKAELRDIQKRELPLNDATLFFHKKETINAIIDGSYFIKDKMYHDILMLKFYTVIQLNMHIDSFDTYMYNVLSLISENIEYDLTLSLDDVKLISQDIANYCNRLRRKDELFHGLNIESYLIYVLSNYKVNLKDMHTTSNATSRSILSLVTIELLQSMKDVRQFNNMVSLLNDCDLQLTKFKSINEIHKAHDLRTEREVAKLTAVNGGKKFVYSTILMNIVKKHGFMLPVSSEAMIVRGKQHNNCVATYAERHKVWHEHDHDHLQRMKYCRILFTKTATVELSVVLFNDIIWFVDVIQYKGRFNANVDISQELIDLCLELAGKPAYIIKVLEVKDDSNKAQ